MVAGYILTTAPGANGGSGGGWWRLCPSRWQQEIHLLQLHHKEIMVVLGLTNWWMEEVVAGGTAGSGGNGGMVHLWSRTTGFY